MRYFLSSNCTKIQNRLFCVEAYGGLLVSVDYDTGETNCNSMEGLLPKKVLLIDFMDYFNGKIYGLDSTGNHLVIFDLNRYMCQYVPLGCAYVAKINFVAFERYGLDYYIFPKYGSDILRFCTQKNEVQKIAKYFNGIKEAQCACRVQNDVWILPKDTNKLYCYHLPNMNETEYQFSSTLRNCVHAVFANGCIYILEKYGIIYEWDTENCQMEIIKDLAIRHEENESMGRIIYAGNKLILLPAYGRNIIILDLLTRITEVYKEYPKDFIYYETSWLKYYGYCEDESCYYFAVCAENYILAIKKQSGKLIWLKPRLDELGKKVIQELNNLGEVIFYEKSLEITDLLSPERSSNVSIDRMIVGKRIYEEG